MKDQFEPMETRLVPVTKENLDELIEFAKDPYFSMPRSRKWFERLLYNDSVTKENENGVRGFLVEKSDGEYVGMLTFSPCHVYIGQEKKIAYWGAVLGVKKKYWEALFDLFKALENDHPNSFAFGNCGANKAAIKVCVACRGDKIGPKEGEYSYNKTFSFARRFETWMQHVFERFSFINCRPRLQLLTKDVVWGICKIARLPFCFSVRRALKFSDVTVCTSNKLDGKIFDDFWQRYLSYNDGIVSSRETTTLSHYFADSLKNKRVILFCAKDKGGHLIGFVFVRKYGLRFSKFSATYRYKIVDIIALKNDKSVLRALVNAIVSHAHSRAVGVVQYIGANPGISEWLQPILTEKIPLGHATFTYSCPATETDIQSALDKNQGWFFGPYDGERCLGHGGYIDN